MTVVSARMQPFKRVTGVNSRLRNVDYRRWLASCHRGSVAAVPLCHRQALWRNVVALDARTGSTEGVVPMFYGSSSVPYVTVDDAARMLRVSAWTLYRNMKEIPHIKVGPEYRIPCEFLMLEPPKVVVAGKTYQPRHYHQPPLPFEVKPVRTWRNSRRPVVLDPYGTPL